MTLYKHGMTASVLSMKKIMLIPHVQNLLKNSQFDEWRVGTKFGNYWIKENKKHTQKSSQTRVRVSKLRKISHFQTGEKHIRNILHSYGKQKRYPEIKITY